MNRWIRLDINWGHSEWLCVLSAESRLVWIELLCYVKAFGTGGRARAMTPDRFARRIYVGEESVLQLLRAAEIGGALDIVDHDWMIANWDKYQKDETAAERMRRYRENKKSDSKQDHVTDVTRNERNVTDVTATKTKTKTVTITNTAGSSSEAVPPWWDSSEDSLAQELCRTVYESDAAERVRVCTESNMLRMLGRVRQYAPDDDAVRLLGSSVVEYLANKPKQKILDLPATIENWAKRRESEWRKARYFRDKDQQSSPKPPEETTKLVVIDGKVVVAK